jgi:hypothetical protein
MPLHYKELNRTSNIAAALSQESGHQGLHLLQKINRQIRKMTQTRKTPKLLEISKIFGCCLLNLSHDM